jgi:Spy/CpxP family protein refolding chaperone
MKDSILKYILIISLLLNVSFLGTAAYTHFRQTRFGPPPFAGLGGPPGQPAPFGPGMFFGGLSLKPEQVKLFQQKAMVFHDSLSKKRKEVDRLRISLIGLMRVDHPDNTAIEATIGRINREQEEMQRTVVSHMLEFKSMLNKDQQKKFLDMIDGAMTQRKETVCP